MLRSPSASRRPGAARPRSLARLGVALLPWLLLAAPAAAAPEAQPATEHRAEPAAGQAAKQSPKDPAAPAEALAPARAPGAPDWGGADGPYLDLLHEQVHRRWSAFLTELRRLDRSYQDPGLAVEVIAVIDGRGALVRVEYLRHAAIKGFDDAPRDLLRDLSLPTPPPQLRSDDGHVYVRWRFSRRPPGCEERSVIERRLLLREALPRLVELGREGEAARRVRHEAPPADRPALLSVYAEALGRVAARAKAQALRELAAPVLAHVPDGESALLAMLSDPAGAVRVRALEALSGRALSPAAAPALRKLLDSEDRAIAALLLSRLRDSGAVPVLREALRAGKRPAESAAALRSLGDVEEAGRIIAQMLEDPVSALGGAVAARALGDPRHAPLLLRHASGQEALRLAVLDALGAMGAKAPPEARKAVLRAMGDLSSKVRARAMRAAAGFGDRSLGLRYKLIDALPDPEPRVRAAAAAALVEVGGETARDELLRVVRDPEPRVRAALLQAALAHPYPSATTLVGRLRKDPVVEALARRTPTSADAPLGDEDEAGPTPQRTPLLSSRVVTLPSAADEETRLAEALLDAREAEERLRAAAGWLALEKK